MSEQTIQPDYEAAIAVWNGYENRGSLRPAIGAAVKPLIEHIEHQSQEIERLAALLNEVREALLKHSQWCGFNPDAPGDPSIHVFDRILAEQLSKAFVEANRDGK